MDFSDLDALGKRAEVIPPITAAGLSRHRAFVANLRRTAGVTAMLPEFSSMAHGPHEIAVVEGKAVVAELADEKELPAPAGGEDEAHPLLRQSRGEGAR